MIVSFNGVNVLYLLGRTIAGWTWLFNYRLWVSSAKPFLKQVTCFFTWSIFKVLIILKFIVFFKSDKGRCDNRKFKPLNYIVLKMNLFVINIVCVVVVISLTFSALTNYHIWFSIRFASSSEFATKLEDVMLI